MADIRNVLYKSIEQDVKAGTTFLLFSVDNTSGYNIRVFVDSNDKNVYFSAEFNTTLGADNYQVENYKTNQTIIVSKVTTDMDTIHTDSFYVTFASSTAFKIRKEIVYGYLTDADTHVATPSSTTEIFRIATNSPKHLFGGSTIFKGGTTFEDEATFDTVTANSTVNLTGEINFNDFIVNRFDNSISDNTYDGSKITFRDTDAEPDKSLDIYGVYNEVLKKITTSDRFTDKVTIFLSISLATITTKAGSNAEYTLLTLTSTDDTNVSKYNLVYVAQKVVSGATENDIIELRKADGTVITTLMRGGEYLTNTVTIELEPVGSSATYEPSNIFVDQNNPDVTIYQVSNNISNSSASDSNASHFLLTAQSLNQILKLSSLAAGATTTNLTKNSVDNNVEYGNGKGYILYQTDTNTTNLYRAVSTDAWKSDNEIRLIYSQQNVIHNMVGKLDNATDPITSSTTTVVLRDTEGTTPTYISKFNSTNLSTTNLSAYNNDNNEITLKSSIVLGADNTYSIGSGTNNRVKNIYSYNVVSNIATIAGTNINSLAATVLDSSKTLTRFTNQLYFEKGAVFGGTAAAAGLVTRGICGINNSGTTFTKDNLYINYEGDNDNTYKSNRQLILQAGSAGTNYGHNVYQYAAVRGDALVDYVGDHADNVATADTLGHIKIGFATNVDGRNYALQLNSGNQAYVNVPWKNPTGNAFSITGNNFSHVTHDAQDITASWNGNNINIPNVKSDNFGHIIAGGTTLIELSTKYVLKAGDTITGKLQANGGIEGSMASNDIWGIKGNGSDDNGELEIYTKDNGNEPIVFKQYSTSGLAHQITLMDVSGNQSFNTVVPAASNTYNLGTSSLRWNNIYANNINSGNIVPASNDKYNLGTSDNRWNYVYSNVASISSLSVNRATIFGTNTAGHGVKLISDDNREEDYILLRSEDVSGTGHTFIYDVHDNNDTNALYKLKFVNFGNTEYNYTCPNVSGTLAVIKDDNSGNEISLTQSQSGDTITLKIGSHTLTFTQAAEDKPLEITFK